MIMSLKQKKRKVKPRIKLKNNIYVNISQNIERGWIRHSTLSSWGLGHENSIFVYFESGLWVVPGISYSETSTYIQLLYLTCSF